MRSLLLLLLVLSPLAQASDWQRWQPVGKATLTWGPFTVYDSQLFTPAGTFTPQQWPLALVITYRRDISHQDLTQATEEQWQAQNIGTLSQRQAWITALNRLWPDVTDGTRLAFQASQQGGQFYWQAPGIASPIKPLGQPFDPAFRDAFLAIWLSEKTTYPDIRRALTGGS